MRARTSFVPALLLSMTVAIGLAATAPVVGADGKAPKQGAGPGADDPRSGAALNRLAARKGAKAPPRLYADDKQALSLPQGSVNNQASDATAQDTQSETTIAAIGNEVAIAWNDSGSYNGVNNHFTGFGYSSNNGLSFADRGALPASVEGDAGDPVLAADQTSDALYLSTLGFTTGENIQVFKSLDQGSSFGAPVNGTPGFGGTGDFQDKEWMTVDNNAGIGQGNIYLCWTRFLAAGGAQIRLTRSLDDGATFGPVSGTLLSAGGQGCFAVVGTDHSVSVFYYRGTGAGGQGGDNKLFMRRSTDQGVTFAPEVMVADLLTTTTNGNLGLTGGLRSNSFPHAAVNPANDDLYVTFNDNPADADNADTYYTRSTNNGATWTAPVQVNNDDSARQQFFPTVASSTDGSRVMFGYYSQANDGVNFHRRGRIGIVNPSGTITLRSSFQMSPDNPIAIGQDPAINPVYMGDYDQIVATPGLFHSSWADNVDGNAFHANQPDVRYSRINQAAASTNPAVSLTGPAAATVGSNVNFQATYSNSGAKRAEDVFTVVTFPSGLVPKSFTPSGGGRCHQVDRTVQCDMGGINPGATKTLDMTVFVNRSGAKSTKATLTTSGSDASAANNTDTVATSATGAGVSQTYSSGNIAVPIADVSTVEVPLNIEQEGAVLTASARVRLDHTFDGDLVLSLISPSGTEVVLSSNNGGSGDNYGTGANSCAGAETIFSDTSAAPITSGVAPFSGSFRPEELQDEVASESLRGVWKLRVADTAGGDIGTIGCFQLVIARDS